MSQSAHPFDPDSTQPFSPISDELLAQLEPEPETIPIFRSLPVNRLVDLEDAVTTFLRHAQRHHLHHEPWYTGLLRLSNLLAIDLRRHFPTDS